MTESFDIGNVETSEKTMVNILSSIVIKPTDLLDTSVDSIANEFLHQSSEESIGSSQWNEQCEIETLVTDILQQNAESCESDLLYNLAPDLPIQTFEIEEFSSIKDSQNSTGIHNGVEPLLSQVKVPIVIKRNKNFVGGVKNTVGEKDENKQGNETECSRAKLPIIIQNNKNNKRILIAREKFFVEPNDPINVKSTNIIHNVVRVNPNNCQIISNTKLPNSNVGNDNFCKNDSISFLENNNPLGQMLLEIFVRIKKLSVQDDFKEPIKKFLEKFGELDNYAEKLIEALNNFGPKEVKETRDFGQNTTEVNIIEVEGKTELKNYGTLTKNNKTNNMDVNDVLLIDTNSVECKKNSKRQRTYMPYYLEDDFFDFDLSDIDEVDPKIIESKPNPIISKDVSSQHKNSCQLNVARDSPPISKDNKENGDRHSYVEEKDIIEPEIEDRFKDSLLEKNDILQSQRTSVIDKKNKDFEQMSSKPNEDFTYLFKDPRFEVKLYLDSDSSEPDESDIDIFEEHHEKSVEDEEKTRKIVIDVEKPIFYYNKHNTTKHKNKVHESKVQKKKGKVLKKDVPERKDNSQFKAKSKKRNNIKVTSKKSSPITTPIANTVRTRSSSGIRTPSTKLLEALLCENPHVNNHKHQSSVKFTQNENKNKRAKVRIKNKKFVKKLGLKNELLDLNAIAVNTQKDLLDRCKVGEITNLSKELLVILDIMDIDKDRIVKKSRKSVSWKC